MRKNDILLMVILCCSMVLLESNTIERDYQKLASVKIEFANYK